MHSKLIILGSGPAGYTSAIYAARANLKPLLITGIQQGGQLMTTTDVDNWPADSNGVLGPDLMTRFEEHAKRFNTQIIFDQIHTCEFQDSPFKLSLCTTNRRFVNVEPQRALAFGDATLGEVPPLPSRERLATQPVCGNVFAHTEQTVPCRPPQAPAARPIPCFVETSPASRGRALVRNAASISA